MKTDATGRSHIPTNHLIAWSIGIGVLLFVAMSMVAASGTPDPTEAVSPSLTTSIVNSAVIVFREGLEAVLIFAAVTASFLGAKQKYRRPVAQGVMWAFAATVATWFVMQAVLGAVPLAQDVLLAVTGLIAVGVLLLVMNWFFHKIYWTEHISGLNARKRDLVNESESDGGMKHWGFVTLGFTSVYREGFEVVLFLQNLQLKTGTAAVMWGVILGLSATTVVGWLTFVAHHKLPYKRMLVLTGVLLGAVLVVMVGGSARTMQDLGWISTTPLGIGFPDWWARWFEIVPTVETLAIQGIAALFVIGSYYAAEWWSKEKRRRATTARDQVAIAAASTPAQARGTAYAQRPGLAPTTVCGAPATTLCGADATAAVRSATDAGGRIPRPRFAVTTPTTIAPNLVADRRERPTRVTLNLPRFELSTWDIASAVAEPPSGLASTQSPNAIDATRAAIPATNPRPRLMRPPLQLRVPLLTVSTTPQESLQS